MLVIPAIDLRNRSVVRLLQGRFDRETRYAVDPVAVAQRWREGGATWLHVVDLDGAKCGRPCQAETVRRIVAEVGGPIQLGGGLRTLPDVDAALKAGVDRVVIGSAALSDPDLVTEAVRRHGDRVAIAIDVRDGTVCVAGWLRDAEVSPIGFAIRLRDAGVARIVTTDIARDGTMRGPNVLATWRIAEASGLAVIASGGVSSLDDLRELARLRDAGVEGAIVGRALYEGRFTLRDAIAAAQEGV